MNFCDNPHCTAEAATQVETSGAESVNLCLGCAETFFWGVNTAEDRLAQLENAARLLVEGWQKRGNLIARTPDGEDDIKALLTALAVVHSASPASHNSLTVCEPDDRN